MVRAAFEGWRRNFHQPQHRLVFGRMAENTNDNASGNRDHRRPTKLRFPQGSEVWIIGCPNYVTTGRSGLINPELKAETVLPEPRRWRSVFVFLGIGRGRCRRGGDWLGVRPLLLSTSPFGLIVFLLLGFVAGVVNVVRSAGVASGKR